jgi:hypothetical protein
MDPRASVPPGAPASLPAESHAIDPHGVGDSTSARHGSLLVVVPRELPSRIGYLEDRLAGTGIEIVLDRRRAERRRGRQRQSQDRRREDRRGDCRVFGYVYGCSIVRVGQGPSS